MWGSPSHSLRFEQTITTCGTPLYMAPEVAVNESFNEQADVFSFGIMLWEIITRRQLYESFIAREPTMFVFMRAIIEEVFSTVSFCGPASLRFSCTIHILDGDLMKEQVPTLWFWVSPLVAPLDSCSTCARIRRTAQRMSRKSVGNAWSVVVQSLCGDFFGAVRRPHVYHHHPSFVPSTRWPSWRRAGSGTPRIAPI